MRNNPGVSVKRGDTEILLIGKRENLFTEEFIGFRNPAFPYLEVSLTALNFHEKVRTKKLFKKAVRFAINHLRAENKIPLKMGKEAKNLIDKEKYDQEIEDIILTHQYLLREDYEILPKITINKKAVVIIFESHEHGIKVRITFQFKRAQYIVFVVAYDEDGNCYNLTRWKKLNNCNSLIKQSEDWEAEINDSNNLFTKVMPVLKSHLILYRFQIDRLISDINDYTASFKKS